MITLRLNPSSETDPVCTTRPMKAEELHRLITATHALGIRFTITDPIPCSSCDGIAEGNPCCYDPRACDLATFLDRLETRAAPHTPEEE